MHFASRMNARIVTSEKCWRGIEEKMPEILREVYQMYWLSIGHVSAPRGRKILEINLKILRDETSLENLEK